MMEINKNTKLGSLLREYPWLVDEAIKFDSRFKVLHSPLGKMFLAKATIADLSKKAGVSSEDLIGKIHEMISRKS